MKNLKSNNQIKKNNLEIKKNNVANEIIKSLVKSRTQPDERIRIQVAMDPEVHSEASIALKKYGITFQQYLLKSILLLCENSQNKEDM